MTLREVCEIAQVSRRAVQGYELAGLVAAYDKNERGYLLYDKNTVEKIKQIKFYQDIGFSIKEIVILYELSPEELKQTLMRQMDKLKQEITYRERLIGQIESLIKSL